MAILVPDDKLDCFGQFGNFFLVKNGPAFNPGPVLPPRTDGSSFEISSRGVSKNRLGKRRS